MPLEVPVKQIGLEASIDAAAKKAGRSLGVNLGKSSLWEELQVRLTSLQNQWRLQTLVF